MTLSHTSELRILVGAGSFADARAALNILRQLTHHLHFCLGGMLVVDHQALELCRMPNQRVISSSGALVIAPNQNQVSTLIKADAKAFQRSLAELADPIGARWVFEQSKGDLVGTSLKASAAWDILVLGHRSVHPVSGKIVVVAPVGSQNEQLNHFAENLALRTSAQRLDMRIGTSSHAHADLLAFESVDAALVRLTRINAQAVLIDLSGELSGNEENLQHVLDVARCPVFVFGASGFAATLEHNTHFPSADPSGTEQSKI